MGAAVHLGDLVGAEGRALHPTAAAHHREPHDDGPRRRPRRRRVSGHAPVPLQFAHGGPGPGPGGRSLGGPRPALQRLALSGGRAPLRGHVVQLHRQAPRLSAGHSRATRRRAKTRCGWPTATKDLPTWWRRWPSASTSPWSTCSARPRAASPWTARAGCRGDRWASSARGSRWSTPTATSGPAPCSTTRAASSTPRSAWARWSTSAGVGPFEGYYRNEEAMARTTRNGWYWSGDLGYVDADGWVYFAGRTSDWLRVDGENFPAAPIEAIVARHPDVVLGLGLRRARRGLRGPGHGGPGAARRRRASTPPPSRRGSTPRAT